MAVAFLPFPNPDGEYRDFWGAFTAPPREEPGRATPRNPRRIARDRDRIHTLRDDDENE
jgi:hypothetical protein